jgi:AcrR family transcriptional regulator
VHYYFPGKNDVLTAALRHTLERAFERQRAELVRIEDAHQRLLKLIDLQLPTVGRVRDEWSVWLQFWAEAAIHPELRPVHNEFYDRWREAVARTVRRGQRQGVFRGDLDVDWVARRLTALTDGAGIQVLTGAADMTVTVMRELLVDFVERELVARPTR